MFDNVYEDHRVLHKPLPEKLDVLPGSAVEKFAPLYWTEHCLECAFPLCYSTCSMFEKSRYNHCKNTEYGILRVVDRNAPIGFGDQLKFKKWCKLSCKFNQNSYAPQKFASRYKTYSAARDVFSFVGRPLNILRFLPKDLLAQSLHHIMLESTISDRKDENSLDGLLLSLFSFSQDSVNLLINCCSFDDFPDHKLAVTAKVGIPIKPGFNNVFIPMSYLGDRTVNGFELYPENDYPLEATFFWLDLAALKKDDPYIVEHPDFIYGNQHADKVKCLIWDLDNTLWQGIIGEDGIENITLNESAAAAIRTLDERGILMSIASKNSPELALAALKRFQMDEYFLCPQINWNPKSESIRQIAAELNLNMNSFAFIDDSFSERGEIQVLCPSVRVYSEKQIRDLPLLEEFTVPVTAESKERRMYYKTDALRKMYEHEKKMDYRDFIRECELVATIFRPTAKEEIDRCVELFQRTNQLNASARRLTENDFSRLLADDQNMIFAFDCKDKFGKYGIVGCIILNIQNDSHVVTDFVISCRVAGKKLESAILTWIVTHFLPGDAEHNVTSDKALHMNYVKTDRNHVLFDEMTAIGGTFDTQKSTLSFSADSMTDGDLVQVVSLFSTPHD